MILMWLGSFIVMVYGMSESQKHMALLFSGLQKKFYDKSFEGTFAKIFMHAADVVVLEASPQKSVYSALALYNMRILSPRATLLKMGLSLLGAWWVLILGLLFLSLNGLFFLGFSSLLLFSFLAMPRLQELFKTLFYAGLFLLGGELMLRSSGVLASMLGESNFAFMLADGRFGAVGILLVLGLLLSLIIEMEFWTMALCLALLASSTLSFNGALALVAGERLGRLLLLALRGHRLNQACAKISKNFALSSGAGVVVGLMIAGYSHGVMTSMDSFDANALQQKNLLFVCFFALILFFQFVGQMVYGHFATQRPVAEVQEARYFSKAWLRRELLSPGALLWAKSRVQARVSEIKYHIQGLQSLKDGQVPEHLQARLKTEEEQLHKLLNEVLPR